MERLIIRRDVDIDIVEDYGFSRTSRSTYYTNSNIAINRHTREIYISICKSCFNTKLPIPIELLPLFKNNLIEIVNKNGE